MDSQSPNLPTAPNRPQPKRVVTAVPRLVALIMLAVLVASLATWYWTRDTLPDPIRIATAETGGLYYKVGGILAPHIAAESGRRVEVVATRGSLDNLRHLVEGRADLAILQSGATPYPGVAVLSPLYLDLCHIVVRKESPIRSIHDLAGRAVSLGPLGSGMRESALSVLRHYRIRPEDLNGDERYFATLETDADLEAAIVTTGLFNPDLQRILASGEFRLLPVVDAEALALHNPVFVSTHIPRGFFREGPPVPIDDLRTLGTPSVLAARDDSSSLLVQSALSALYNNHLRADIPTLIDRSEAASWDHLPVHPAARSFFEPYSGLGILANFMESLAALKELLFALGAGLYLLWAQWKRARERERQAMAVAEKEHLDEFFERTMEIERRALEESDPQRLQRYLQQITELKLRALEELTHEDLRGDVQFSIFLQQCGNLIRKLQTKILIVLRTGHYPEASAAGEPGRADTLEDLP